MLALRVVTHAFLLRVTSAQSWMREYGTGDGFDRLGGVAVNGEGHVLAVGDSDDHTSANLRLDYDALVISIPNTTQPTTWFYGGGSGDDFLTGVSASGNSGFVAVGEHR